jgi:flagellar biosynthesis anti-sigma factor FlgM
MKISNNLENLTQILPSQPVTGVSLSKGAGNAPVENGNADKAQLSAAASQVAESAAAPDVRLDKVASIQSALQNGTYAVPASAVAKKVIDSMLDTEK